MYALEAHHPPTDSATSNHIEPLQPSNLYNLDSASISGYTHPSSHSPYANPAAHSLLLPSTANYHSHLELTAAQVSGHGQQHMEVAEAHQRISNSSG